MLIRFFNLCDISCIQGNADERIGKGVQGDEVPEKVIEGMIQ